MKELNDSKIILLDHAITGERVKWRMSSDAKASTQLIIERADAYSQELNAYAKKHDLPKNDEGTIDQAALKGSEHVNKVNELITKSIQQRIKAIATVLEPVDGLPEETSKLHYLEECIDDYRAINAILDFFFKHIGSSTTPPEPYSLTTLDSAGNEV